MPNHLLLYLLVPVFIVVVPILLARYIDRTVIYQNISRSRPLVFTVSGWMFGVLAFVIIIFGCFGIIGFIYASVAKMFFLLLGAFFVLLSVFEIWCLSKAKIVISEEILTYIKVRKETTVELSMIKSIVTANGLIIIDTGTIPRPVLPMYFQRTPEIVAILRQYTKVG